MYYGLFYGIAGLICFILSCVFMASVASADEVKCYSAGHLIYKSEVKNPTFDENGIFIFEEVPNKTIVFVAGECVVKVNHF